MKLWQKQEEEEEYQAQEDSIQAERLKSKQLYKSISNNITYWSDSLHSFQIYRT